MSIFQVIASKRYSTINSLQEILTYVTRVTGTRSALIYGAYVSPFNPFAQMEYVKGVFAQEDGKTFYHYVFNPDADIDLNTAYLMGIDMANAIANFGGKFQVIMAVHVDKELPHCHFVANNIDFETGARFDLNKKNLYDLKTLLSSIAESYGVSAILRFSFPENDGN